MVAEIPWQKDKIDLKYGISNGGTIKDSYDTEAVKNYGTFIRTKGNTIVESIYDDGIYKEVDAICDEQWKPTEVEDKRRYACYGKELIKYNCAKENPYEITAYNAVQGPKCFVSFDAVLGDYAIARTYNIYPTSGQTYTMDQKAKVQIEIPSEFCQEERVFKMICVTEGGTPIILEDLDQNPNTITFETNKFFAFALIYK